MKKMIFAMMLVLGITTSGWATQYYFYGTDSNGAASAIMDISISGNTLTLALDNTSPTTLLSGTGVNAPGITGFGFMLDNLNYLNVVSWQLTAYATQNAATPITIGSNTNTTYWQLGATKSGVTLDYLNYLKNVKGALYNPAVTDGQAALPDYYTEAILTVTFNSAPVISTVAADLGSGISGDEYVRMMNVGINGSGSVKLTAAPVPEPGTILLLGGGLLGLGGFARRRMNKL